MCIPGLPSFVPPLCQNVSLTEFCPSQITKAVDRTIDLTHAQSCSLALSQLIIVSNSHYKQGKNGMLTTARPDRFSRAGPKGATLAMIRAGDGTSTQHTFPHLVQT